jgi:hypothetical protein
MTRLSTAHLSQEDAMPADTGQRYIDHPAPSVVFMTILLLVVVGLVAALPGVVNAASRGAASSIPIAVVGLCLILVCFYFWPLYTTYYTVSATGLLVRYGPWNHQYAWSEFVAASWQKGMFATRIGWPSVTPCVRLTNAVLLKRRTKRLGLYLTPNDPRAFLLRVAEFAPDLTRETIL